ncbi:hypothetical protein [Shewanella septentrionalis]|uniref:Uncharacterized protein n=1 Tax=Shewanella septentrionalis TaxID=2952223 RepID=A0A9X3AVN5_9GAMM|nr:hypothetical protein [Shewanella septentrionalis]MCT7947702.1 hypothetical protein [Shewanella septentrionalis]
MSAKTKESKKKEKVNNELTLKRRKSEFIRDLQEQGLTREEIDNILLET